MENRGWYLPIAVAVLLLAAGLRLYGLSFTPLGLSDSELINTRLAGQLLQGNIRIIYDSVSPAREGIYHAVIALTSTVFGQGMLLWRLPSVWISMITVALTMRFTRELFGVRVSLLAAGLLAVAFWPVWLGRSVLHVILMPPLALLTFYTFARAYRAEELTAASLWFTLGGLLLGVTLYAHVTAWTVAAVLVAFVLLRALLDPPDIQRHWSNLLYALGLVLVLSLPLTIYLLNNPGVRELAPLLPERIAAIPARLVGLASVVVPIGAPRAAVGAYALPGGAVIGPVVSGLGLIGVGVALRRWRRPEYSLALLWLIIGLIPAALIPEFDPEALAVVMPVLFIFPAMGLKALTQGLERRANNTIQARAAAFAVSALLVAAGTIITWQTYFGRWAQSPQVAEAYNARMGGIARYLDTTDDPTPVSVCTFPVFQTRNPAVTSNEAHLRTIMHRSRMPVRYYNCGTSLVLADGGGPQRHIFPSGPYYNSMPAPLIEWMRFAEPEPVPGLPDGTVMHLDASDVIADRVGAFITTAPTAWPPESGTRLVQLPVTFDFNMDFLGYRVRDPVLEPAQPVELITYWRVNGPPPRELTMFAHLLGNPVLVISQVDSFGAEARTLHPRDIVIQYSRISTPTGIGDGLYPISVGLYFPRSSERLTAFENGIPVADRLFLQRIEVVR